MKKTYIAMAIAAMISVGLTAKTANAEDLPYGITAAGDIGVASQYVWRGVTQTNGKTAIQGDMSLSYGGFSVGGWFSNAYPSPAPQFSPRDVVEFDWTAGYSGEFADTGIGYSVGGIYYTYLYDSASNFPEINAGLSWGPLSLTGYYVTTNSNNKAYLAGDTWVDLGVSHSLGGFDLSGTVSYAKWKKDALNRPLAAGGPDMFKSGVNLLTLGLSKDFKLGDVGMTYSLTATVPIIKKATDGNRYIYGVAAKNEFVAALNMGF